MILLIMPFLAQTLAKKLKAVLTIYIVFELIIFSYCDIPFMLIFTDQNQ